MYDHQLYLKTLSEFTRVLLTPYDVHVVLRELTERVVGVLGIRGAGVGLADGDRLVFDPRVAGDVAELEDVQERTQKGPCVSAFHTGRIVQTADLSQDSQKWPEFREVAARHGVRAVASIPMRLGEQSVGALNLYDDQPRAWEREDMNAAVVMADMATSYLLNASKHRQQVELSTQLQYALDHRLVIEQAKGMLAARHEVTPEEAFERLRRHARSRGATVHAVADAVVNLGMDL